MTAPGCIILFVPGIRAKPLPELHERELRRCVSAGVTAAGATVAEAAVIAGNFELIGWSADFYGSNADIAADLPGIERLLADKGDPLADLQEATAWSRRLVAMFYAIGDRLPLLSRLFTTHRMRTRLQDINRYFDDETGAGTRARAMLADRLQSAWDQGTAVLLVGHSFGSVIAYDTLWDFSHGRPRTGSVELFLTLGSPLTLRYIHQRLQGAAAIGRKRYPANIRRWQNILAVGEVAAQDHRVSDCFGEMQSLGLLDTIEDNLTMLNHFRGPEGLNPHKCYGYFANVVVGRVILQQYRKICAVRG